MKGERKERLGMMASSMREFYRSKPSPERSEMSQVSPLCLVHKEEIISMHILGQRFCKKSHEYQSRTGSCIFSYGIGL